MFKALWPCLMNSHDLCCFGSLVLFASVQPRLGPSFHASLWWDWPRLVPSTCRTSISDLETGKGPTVHQCPSMSIRYILGDARFKNGRWTPPSKQLPKTTFRAKQFWHSNTSLCYISICTNIRRLVTFFDAAFLFRSFLPPTILGSLVQNYQGWYFD